MKKLSLPLLAAGLVLSGLAFLGAPAPAAADSSCSSPVSNGGESDFAGLVVQIEVNGDKTNGIRGTLNSDAYSIVKLSGYDKVDNTNSKGFTSGDNIVHCSAADAKGEIHFGYRNSFGSDDGNGWALDCKKETSGGGYTENVAHFSIDMGGSPTGNPGHWNTPGSFRVYNGSTVTKTVNWVDNPPANGNIKGDKYNVDTGALLSDSDDGGYIHAGTVKTYASPFYASGQPSGSTYFSAGSFNDWTPVKIKYADLTAHPTCLSYAITNSCWSTIGDTNGVPSTYGGDFNLNAGHTYYFKVFYQYQLGFVNGDKYNATTGALLSDADDNGKVCIDGECNTGSPFAFDGVAPGTDTFSAYDYNAWKVTSFCAVHVTPTQAASTACSHQNTTGNALSTGNGRSFNFSVGADQTDYVKVFYAYNDNSACASPATANPTTVAAGSSFNYNLAYTNTGAHAWSASGTSGYGANVYFQNNKTANGVPAGTVNVGSPSSPEKLVPNALTTSTNQTAQFDISNTPHNEATFTAPTTPGTYWINTAMRNATGSQFGATCSYPVTVVNREDYVPRITSSNYGGSATLPATSNFVAPGAVVQLKETVTNNLASSSAPGDPYSYAIQVYSGSYNGSTHTANLSGAAAPVTTGASGSGTGLAAGASRSHTATYTVPTNTPDGTQVCFYGSVTPASNKVAGAPDPEVTNRYTDFVDTFPAADDNTNIRSAYAPGNIVNNDMCVEVESVRSANIQVKQGDTHAGGNILSGASCAAPAANTGNITANNDSVDEYVVSASGNVVGFRSGNGYAGGNALTLSNLGSTGGKYGYICRPDLAAVANAYPSAKTVVIPASTTSMSATSFNQSKLYQHTGPLTITGGVINVGVRATLYNVGTVTINGNVTFSANAANVSSLPSFGVITGNGGNILVSKNVTELDGFYFASNTNSTNGFIDTCYEHDGGVPTNPSHQTGDCPNPLNVLGSLTGHGIYFWRTGATGAFQSGSITTETVTQSGILFLAPPPAFETQANSPYALPQYSGEFAPLY